MSFLPNSYCYLKEDRKGEKNKKIESSESLGRSRTTATWFRTVWDLSESETVSFTSQTRDGEQARMEEVGIIRG